MNEDERRKKLDELKAAYATALAAAYGDSNDDEIEAWQAVGELAADLLGISTTELEPQQYEVSWVIDSTASTPREAAEKAWADMRREDSIANVFDVKNVSTGVVERVDLSGIE